MCPFCYIDPNEVIFETENFFGVFDKYPINKGHMLILSKSHILDFFDLDSNERYELVETIDLAKSTYEMLNKKEIGNWNIGMNCGLFSGQTIDHFHAHLIPRFAGDCSDPEGGVRGVVPDKQKYSHFGNPRSYMDFFYSEKNKC